MSQNRIMKTPVLLVDRGAGTLCLTRETGSCEQQEWELHVGTKDLLSEQA